MFCFGTLPMTADVIHPRGCWRITACVCIGLLLAIGGSARAAAPSLLRLTTDTGLLEGRLEAMGGDRCWLMQPDGQLVQVALGEIHSMEKGGPFRSLPARDLRDQLRRELGNDFEVVGTGHYLVCAQRGQARRYAETFEQIYRSFHVYFSRRGFRIDEPEFPLVAVVYPDRPSFARNCRDDGIAAAAYLQGYYLTTSNRIALYDPSPSAASLPSRKPRATTALLAQAGSAASRQHSILQRSTAEWNDILAGTIRGGLRDTIVHETTHQVAYNTGLHSRLGHMPKWVVEGLATVFESPGLRDGHGPDKAQINRERFVWFGNFRQRREAGALRQMVESDSLFRSSVLDAYSQAWAVSFFLLKTRSAEYTKYLQTLTQRPDGAYLPEQRLQDFQKAFGEDLDRIDLELQRFLDRL